jgi:hypothetical protein
MYEQVTRIHRLEPSPKKGMSSVVSTTFDALGDKKVPDTLPMNLPNCLPGAGQTAPPAIRDKPGFKLGSTPLALFKTQPAHASIIYQ